MYIEVDQEIPMSHDSEKPNNLNIVLPSIICSVLVLSILITTFIHRRQELDILRVALERSRRRSSDNDNSNVPRRSGSRNKSLTSSREGLDSTNSTDLTSEASSGFHSRRRKSLPSYVESIEHGHASVTRSHSSSD